MHLLIHHEPHFVVEDISTELQKPKRVSFAEQDDVHEIDDYDFEWNEAAWYQVGYASASFLTRVVSHSSLSHTYIFSLQLIENRL